MIIPKLLLLVPLLLLVKAQYGPQRDFSLSARLPLQRSGFTPEATVPPVPNTPMTTKQVSEVVTKQYIPTVKEVTTDSPKIAYDPISIEQESETNKPGPSVPRQPIQRQPWPRPSNPPSRVTPGLASVTPPYTTPQYISPASAIDVEVTSKNPEIPENKAPEPNKDIKEPGFTIVFGENYTTESLPVGYPIRPISPVVRQPIQRLSEPVYVPRSLESDNSTRLTISRPGKPSFTIIIIKNDDAKPDETLTDVTTSNPVTTKTPPTTIYVTPTQSEATTYKQPDTTTPIFRVPDPTSSIAPPSTSILTPTWRPTTIFQTRPTPPQTPPSTITPTWSPTTVQTRPTPPQTPPSTITPTWRPTTVQTRPTPNQTPPSTITPTWRPTTVQTRPTPPQTPPSTITPTWRPTTSQTRPTPPQTPTAASTTTWRPTTIQTSPTPPETSTPRPTTTWKPTTSDIPMRTTPPQINIINQLYDYNCRNANGYYSVENKCDEYIVCKNNNAYQIMCPDGLHFDSAAKWPAYPCAYPSEVKCESQSIKQEPQPTNECPHRYGYFPVPNGDCGHFIMCQEGLATVMPCPPGLAFNVKTSTCDWPINVPGCNPSVFQDFVCPATRDYEIINYRYKNSCKNYIACHEGRPRLLSCDSGFSFDDQTGKCVESSLIRNCEN